MRFDNNRISHWIIGALFTWVVIFVAWALPIFHLWLKAPVARIAVYTAICCAMQLAITPWLFSARATERNPRGRIGRRAVALTVLFSGIALLLFGYIPLTTSRNHNSRLFATIAFVMTALLALIALVAARVVSRRDSDAPETSSNK